MLGDDAGRGALKEIDRQRQQTREGADRGAHIDSRRGVDQQDAPQIVENRVEQDRRADPDGEHSERRIGLVHEHFVDRDLDEDRQGKRQHLQGDRGHRDVAEHRAVADDFGEEPGKAEGSAFIAQREGAAQQQELAGPLPAERCLVEGQYVEAVSKGVEDADLVVIESEQDDAVVVRQPGDHRIGVAEALQVLPADLQFAAAHAAAAGDLRQQPGDVVVGPQRKVVLDAFGGKIDAVVPPDGDKALQCCFDWRSFHGAARITRSVTLEGRGTRSGHPGQDEPYQHGTQQELNRGARPVEPLDRPVPGGDESAERIGQPAIQFAIEIVHGSRSAACWLVGAWTGAVTQKGLGVLPLPLRHAGRRGAVLGMRRRCIWAIARR
ncbi:hypothetical protein MPL3365_270007 [Mesorhizobium plurifarium]|uniref:Uncharacterized protein n=1 Tax=Mesorhizobium plurifarium TaxID=69974 RepID=A0A090GCF7_MESPL|nr:hypothetical protein MPL3365_270007 [Mesorhizobium plurifarium]